MARGLFAHFIGAIRGPSQYRKASFLLDAAGAAGVPAFLQCTSGRTSPRASPAAPSTQEGAATRDRELVRDGVLDGYVLGSYSARRLGLKTTGNAGGIHNLIVTSTQRRSTRRRSCPPRHRAAGDRAHGAGRERVTGDYSRGASGFWVESGAIAYPVHEITIAGNLKPMYRDIVALGSDVDRARRHPHRLGALGEMTIAGE